MLGRMLGTIANYEGRPCGRALWAIRPAILQVR